jgi:hypothetical protein
MAVRSSASPTGFVERLTYYVVESKFARQPLSAPVERASFRNIESYDVGKSAKEVDEAILGVVQQLVNASDFRCDRQTPL